MTAGQRNQGASEMHACVLKQALYQFAVMPDGLGVSNEIRHLVTPAKYTHH